MQDRKPQDLWATPTSPSTSPSLRAPRPSLGYCNRQNLMLWKMPVTENVTVLAKEKDRSLSTYLSYLKIILSVLASCFSKEWCFCAWVKMYILTISIFLCMLFLRWYSSFCFALYINNLYSILPRLFKQRLHWVLHSTTQNLRYSLI